MLQLFNKLALKTHLFRFANTYGNWIFITTNKDGILKFDAFIEENTFGKIYLNPNLKIGFHMYSSYIN